MTTVITPLIEKKRIGLELRKVMASQFNIESCRLLSEFWEGPVGRKFVNAQVQVLSTGKGPELNFTPSEKAISGKISTNRRYSGFHSHPTNYSAEDSCLHKRMRQRMKEELARRNVTATGN